jgi:Cu+-exporting ATPase
LETIRFPVTGMTCGSCVNRITRALRRLDGVAAVRVDLGRETATVRRDPQAAPDDVLAAAVSEAGYQADLTAAQIAQPNEALGLLSRLFRRLP